VRLRSPRFFAAAAVLAACLAIGAAAAAAGVDPKVALRADDQAVARDLVSRRADFGTGWAFTRFKLGSKSIASGSLCAGFHPDLARLTITGQAAARATRGTTSAVTVALVLARAAQARALAAALEAPFVRQCFKVGKTRNGVRVDSVSRDSLAGAPRFRPRMMMTAAKHRYYADYVYLSAGRRWISAVFTSVGPRIPASVERRAIRALQRRIAR